MADHADDEERLIRASALQNAAAILAARQRADRELAAERERLRITLASIGDGVISTDADGRVTFLNGVAEALTGWAQADAVGRPLPDVFRIVNEHTRRTVENPAERALKEGVVVGLANHTVLIARDGTERPIDDSAAPMRGDSATAVGAVLVFRDVTDRKRAEEAMARLAAIVESSDDAIVSKTLDGVIRSWNRGAERTFGYTAEEAVGQHITLIIPPDRLDEEREILARLRRGERLDHYETIRVTKDGRLVHISLSVSPLRDSEGHIIGAAKVARDITERIRGEAALRESAERHRQAAAANAKFRTLFEQGTQFAGILTVDGTVVEANRLCLEFCGFTRDDVIGKPFWECGWWNRSPDLVAAVRSACGRAAAGHVVRGESKYFVADGSERVVDLVIAPVTDDSGTVLFLSPTGTDITDRKRAEESLRESEGRHRFLAELAAATQPLTDPDEIMAATARLLAEHLQVDRCAYAEVEDESVYVITGDHTRGVPSIVGRWPVAAFGAEHHRMMKADEPYVVCDTDTDPRIGPDDLPAYRATTIRAVVCVPLHKDGRFAAAMAVHQTTPRAWTTQEVALIRTVVARCWEALERARVARALRGRDERLQLFLGNATDYAVILSDPDDLVVEWLGGAEQITGWRAEEVMGQPVALIFTPEDRAERVPERETEKAASDGRADNTRWHQRKDGSRFFADGVTVPLRGPAGELRGFGKVFRDATAQRRAQDDLARQTERLRLLWEAASVLLTTEEPDAMLRGMFDKIATHLGLDTYFNYMVTEAGDELQLASCIGVPEDVARSVGRLGFGEAVCGTVALRREGVVVCDVQRSDDPRVELVKGLGIRAYVCNPLLADGRMLGTLSFGSRSRDAFGADELEFLKTVTHYITVAYERLRLVRELRESDRKKDDFIALLAHELRNPLAPIRNGLQVMRLSEDRAVRVRSQDMMDRQLTHMVRLIDDLLDVSRISRNKMELRRGRVRLSDVVSSAVETARPLIDAAGHTLEVSLPPEPVLLDADLTRLAQVFSNLLTNSAKYTPPGGRIWLTAESRNGRVTVVVRDNGIGIPPAALQSIFDMFSQVDRSVERSTGGLGIGLALVKGLVEMHGGTVTAESAGPGRGSTFTVWLPALDRTATTTPSTIDTADGEPRPGHGRRVLVVDDNRDSGMSMAMMLQLLGDDVRTAHDGVEAVEAAEVFRPDLILMDVGMPRLNGYEATRQIRERPWGKAVTVIALTGWGQEGDRTRSREAGCDGHLVKPVTLSDLEQLLAELKAQG